MANVNVNRIGRDAQRDGELSYDERVARNVVEVDPFAPPRPRDAAAILALGAVLGGAWLLVLLALGAGRLIACWGGCYGGPGLVGWLLWAWLILPVAAALLACLAALWGYVARERATAARVAVTRDRFGNEVSALAVHRRDDRRAWAALELATRAKIATAPYEIYRGADALSLTQAPPAPPAELAAPALPIGPLPLEQWGAHVDRQPHTMLAAKTGGGKSTMAKFILAGRIAAGEQVFIIDPHWSPANWWGLPGHGGGEAWEEIAAAFDAVIGEYLARLAEYKDGKPTEAFRRLTVLVDEAVITKAEFDRKDRWGRSSPWARFAVVLGSGARKVRVSVILMTQSPNVTDLGLSAPLRENYSRIALDARACRLLIEEDGSRERREALYAALPGQGEYPATMEVSGEVFYLDRADVVHVERPAAAEDAVWGVMPKIAPSPVPRPAHTPSPPPDRGVGDGDGDGTGALDVVSLLRTLRGRGFTRDQARAELRKAGIEFRNNLWTAAGGGEE